MHHVHIRLITYIEKIFWRLWGTNQLLVSIDFRISTLCKSMASSNGLVIFFCVQQKKVTQTGLEQHEDLLYFYVNYPHKIMQTH